MLMTTETVSYATRLSDTPLPAWPRRMMQQVDMHYDPNLRTLWTYMKPIGIPCFNQNMLEELHYIFTELQTYQGHTVDGDAWVPVDYSVMASRRSGVFNLGGDLMLFLNLIREKDREGLLNYAMYCVDSIYTRIIGYDASTVTISLVQGDALGGGFELALASDLIVAEAGTRLGLPEILFNLFSGMGAYSFLARRIGARKTEAMLLSGNIYTAEQLAEMGVVDIVAPAGEGKRIVEQWIRKHHHHLNGMRAIYDCRRHVWPVTHKELTDIAVMWVDAALKIQEKDLRMMRRLLKAQSTQHSSYRYLNPANPVETADPVAA
ncbi:MAG: crotonase/enoyl-CoA hydratase family protein [Burkholderiaceae bacterium]|jgi:DSF synthase|nr:crotonase/enoyl-CoA hydratase family protein [Oxalobacteraceae bacterium]